MSKEPFLYCGVLLVLVALFFIQRFDHKATSRKIADVSQGLENLKEEQECYVARVKYDHHLGNPPPNTKEEHQTFGINGLWFSYKQVCFSINDIHMWCMSTSENEDYLNSFVVWSRTLDNAYERRREACR